jgi:hypothetical protein
MNMASVANSSTAGIPMGYGSEEVTDEVIVDTFLKDLKRIPRHYITTAASNTRVPDIRY